MSHSGMKYGFAVDDRVEVVAPLAENYACATGTVRAIYMVNTRQRFRVEFDNNEFDDFFGSELRMLQDKRAAS